MKKSLMLFVIFLNAIICLSRFSIVKENKQALELNISSIKYEYYDLLKSMSISFLSKHKFGRSGIFYSFQRLFSTESNNDCGTPGKYNCFQKSF